MELQWIGSDMLLKHKTHLPCHGGNEGSRTCCGYEGEGMASCTAGISGWCQWQSICHAVNKDSPMNQNKKPLQ
jgi:hypothetical protein